MVAPWHPQKSRVVWVGKSEPHEPRGVQLFLEFPPNLSDFPAKFGSLNVKITNYMGNICIPFKCSNHVNNKSRPCKYHATPLKRKKRRILVKFMIYSVLSQFQICLNLRAFPLFSTWSSSSLHSPSLPLKPILNLCHPLATIFEPAMSSALVLMKSLGCLVPEYLTPFQSFKPKQTAANR